MIIKCVLIWNLVYENNTKKSYFKDNLELQINQYKLVSFVPYTL